MIVSILLPSCSGYLVDEYNAKDNIYGKFAKDGELGNLLIDVNAIEFSDTFKEHSAVIASIIQDVTTNKASAELFCSDIDAYLAQKNYAASIQLTEEEKSIIRALTDDDILQAAQSNDLQLFLTLCKQRGYLSRSVVNINSADNFDYSKFFQTEDDYLKYRQMISNIYSSQKEEIVSEIAVLAGAIVVVIGAVYVLFIVKVKVDVYGATEKREVEPIFKLWTKESNRKLDYDIVRSELIVKTVDEYVAAISAEISGVKKEALKEFLVVNLEKHYGFEK